MKCCHLDLVPDQRKHNHKNMKKHLLLAAILLHSVASFAQKQHGPLKHLEQAPDRHLVEAIFKKQQAAEPAGKTTATQKRLLATSYMANGTLEDSNRHYYSQGRGSVKNTAFDYFYPTPTGTQQIASDTSINWHDNPQNGFQRTESRHYTYDANNRVTKLEYLYSNYNNETEAEYNTAGQLIKTRALDTIGGTPMQPKSERAYFYDGQGRYLGDSTYSLVTNQPMAKTVQNYDAAGNLVSYDSYSWQNNTWEIYFRTVYTYDANNRMVDRYSQYSFMGGGLANNTRDTFAYNGTSTTAYYTGYYFWSTAGANWYPVESFIYQFKSGSLIDTYYVREWSSPGMWDTLERDVYYYDIDDNLLQSKAYQYQGGGVFDAVNYDVQTLYYEDYFPAGIKETEQQNSMVLYPNPVKDKLYIKTKEHTESNISILNTLGKKVLGTSINTARSTIDMGQLPPGSYMIIVTDRKGYPVYSGQIIKQ